MLANYLSLNLFKHMDLNWNLAYENSVTVTCFFDSTLFSLAIWTNAFCISEVFFFPILIHSHVSVQQCCTQYFNSFERKQPNLNNNRKRKQCFRDRELLIWERVTVSSLLYPRGVWLNPRVQLRSFFFVLQENSCNIILAWHKGYLHRIIEY